jgi:hypothetical protein
MRADKLVTATTLSHLLLTGMAATIDKVLGTSERRQVSYGQIFTAMLLNSLGFPA